MSRRQLLVVSDLFTERSQFETMYLTLTELRRVHPSEDEILQQYLVPATCKAAAVLGMVSGRRRGAWARVAVECAGLGEPRLGLLSPGPSGYPGAWMGSAVPAGQRSWLLLDGRPRPTAPHSPPPCAAARRAPGPQGLLPGPFVSDPALPPPELGPVLCSEPGARAGLLLSLVAVPLADRDSPPSVATSPRGTDAGSTDRGPGHFLERVKIAALPLEANSVTAGHVASAGHCCFSLMSPGIQLYARIETRSLNKRRGGRREPGIWAHQRGAGWHPGASPTSHTHAVCPDCAAICGAPPRAPHTLCTGWQRWGRHDPTCSRGGQGRGLLTCSRSHRTGQTWGVSWGLRLEP